jgi:hypothetical protein
MATQIILLAIVLASTVIGTVSNAKRWFKVCLIALAISSAFVSLLKAYNDNQDSEFIKGALAAEMASTKPTPRFERAFSSSLNRVAHTKGMRIDQSVRKDQETLYFLVTQYGGGRSGVVQFNADQEGEAYTDFVSKRSMDAVLSDAMFKVPNLLTDEAKTDVLAELGFVGNIALEENVNWAGSGTQITQNFNYDPLQVQVKGTSGNNTVSAELDPKFLESILHDPPYARDWKAYQEFERQVRSGGSVRN